MRELVARYLSRSISRRTFLKGLATSGLSAAAAQSVLDSLVPAAQAQAAGEAAKVVEGPGALCFAEQLIACGEKALAVNYEFKLELGRQMTISSFTASGNGNVGFPLPASVNPPAPPRP